MKGTKARTREKPLRRLPPGARGSVGTRTRACAARPTAGLLPRPSLRPPPPGVPAAACASPPLRSPGSRRPTRLLTASRTRGPGPALAAPLRVSAGRGRAPLRLRAPRRPPRGAGAGSCRPGRAAPGMGARGRAVTEGPPHCPRAPRFWAGTGAPAAGRFPAPPLLCPKAPKRPGMEGKCGGRGAQKGGSVGCQISQGIRVSEGPRKFKCGVLTAPGLTGCQGHNRHVVQGSNVIL